MFEQARFFLEANFSRISDEEWAWVEGMLERVEVAKGEHILKIGRYVTDIFG